MAKFLKFSSSLAYRAGDSVLGQVNQTIDSAGIDRDFPIFLLSLVQRGGCQYPGDTLLPAVRQSVISQPDDLDYWLTYSGGTLQVVNTNTYQRIGAGQGLMGGQLQQGPIRGVRASL